MTFTVHCSGCDAAFPIDSAKVPFPGVYAECSECTTVFLVRPPEDDALQDAGASSTIMIDAREAFEAPAAQYETLPAEPLYESDATTALATEDRAGADAAPEHDFPELSVLESPEVLETESEMLETAVEDGSDDEIEDFSETVEPFESVAKEASFEAPPAEPEAEPEIESEPEPEPVPAASPFGRRDPHERARRLARVLVSDMIAYYPDRHRQSLRAGSLAKDFEEEIEKSWSEYVDQVGKDMADETTYFKDALNDVLAEGNEIF